MKQQKKIWENILTGLIVLILIILSAFLTKPVKEVELFKLTPFQKKALNVNQKNILILGIVGFESRSPLLTDVIMVVNINFDTKKTHIFSIPRDLLIEVPKRNYFAKINSLLTLDNPNLKIKKTDLIALKTEEITGLKIDNVAIVDLNGFKYFIDAIGGINIYLEKTLFDPILLNPDNFDEMFKLDAGWNYLDGEKAAKFIRSRHGPAGDFYRIDHQHDLLLAVFQKLKQMNIFSNPVLVYKIYNSWSGYLYTDFNITDAIKFLPMTKNLLPSDITFFSISFSPPDPMLISNRSDIYGYFLQPIEGLENYSKIQNHIYNIIY